MQLTHWKNAAELHELMRVAVSLLEESGEESWASTLKYLDQKIDEDLVEAKAEIRKIYGGMGSFNDLVLHKKSVPMHEENELLSEIRRKIFASL